MVMFALNPTEIENGYNNASANPYVPERDSAAGFFDGSGTAMATGFQQGGAEAAMMFAPAEQEPAIQNYLNSLKPDPQVTGWLGNVIQGFSSAIPAAAVGTVSALGNPVGGALAVGEVKGYAKMKELQSEGVDPATAAITGTIEGITQSAGFLLPASLGGKILSRTASGAAINTVLGATQRGATGSILEANGYKDMAEQYRVLDGTAIFSDMILGGLFGATARGGHAEPLPSEVDAALAANNVHHLEIDSAPGIPADVATRNAHIEAIDTALDQAARGEPINVDLTDGNFLAKPENPEIRGMDEAITEHLQDMMTPELARETMTAKAVESPYADLSAKIERMDEDMQATRFESLNKKMEAGVALTTREMYERETLSARSAPQLEAKSPEDQLISASTKIAMEKPALEVMTEDGPMTALDAVAKAEAEKTQVEKEASVFDAAINCFLRFE